MQKLISGLFHNAFSTFDYINEYAKKRVISLLQRQLCQTILYLRTWSIRPLLRKRSFNDSSWFLIESSISRWARLILKRQFSSCPMNVWLLATVVVLWFNRSWFDRFWCSWVRSSVSGKFERDRRVSGCTMVLWHMVIIALYEITWKKKVLLQCLLPQFI